MHIKSGSTCKEVTMSHQHVHAVVQNEDPSFNIKTVCSMIFLPLVSTTSYTNASVGGHGNCCSCYLAQSHVKKGQDCC